MSSPAKTRLALTLGVLAVLVMGAAIVVGALGDPAAEAVAVPAASSIRRGVRPDAEPGAANAERKGAGNAPVEVLESLPPPAAAGPAHSRSADEGFATPEARAPLWAHPSSPPAEEPDPEAQRAADRATAAVLDILGRDGGR